MKKPETLIESYQSWDGRTIIIKEMKDAVLMNTYRALLEILNIRKRNLKHGVEVTTGRKPDIIKTVIKIANPEEEEKHIKGESDLVSSLRFEAVQRKLLSR